MVGNPMHAEVKADVSDYVSGMTVAAERTDELGEEASGAARRVDRLGEDAGETSARLHGFSASALGATTATQALSAATTASLVPALATLSATAVPLAATLGGLATASAGVATGFGAVVGSGLYAYGNKVAESTEGVEGAMGGLNHALKPVKEQLHETAMEIGSNFTPLIEDTIEALPAFIRRIQASLGPLQPFADALRDAGQAAFDLVPRLVEVSMNMARDMLPALRDLGSYIADNAVPALQAMRDTTGDVVDLFAGVPSAIADAIPALNEFGTTVLETVVPAARDAGSALGGMLEKFNTLSEQDQKIAIGAAVSGPAVLGVITQLTRINPILGGIAAGAAGLAVAWETNFMGIQEVTEDVVDESMPHIERLRDDAEDVFDDAASAAGDFVDGVERNFELLEPSLGSLGEQLLSLSREMNSAIQSVVRSLRPAFDSIQRIVTENGPVIRDVLRSIMGAIEGIAHFAENVLVPAWEFLWTEVVAPITNKVAKAVADNIGPVLDELGQTIDALVGHAETLGSVMLDIWRRIDGVVVPIVRGLTKIIERTLVTAINVLSDGLKTVMNLVQGDFGEALNNLKSMLSGAIEGALDILGVIKDGIFSAAAWLGANALRLIKSGIGGVFDTIIDIVGAIANGLVAVAKKAPSWVANKLGGFLFDLSAAIADAVVSGFAKGIADVAPDLRGWGLTVPTIPLPGGPGMDTGGLVGETGMATVHAGERVLPEAQVDERGRASFDPSTIAQGVARADRTDEVVRKLDEVKRAIVEEGGADIEFRDQDRYRMVRR